VVCFRLKNKLKHVNLTKELRLITLLGCDRYDLISLSVDERDQIKCFHGFRLVLTQENIGNYASNYPKLSSALVCSPFAAFRQMPQPLCNGVCQSSLWILTSHLRARPFLSTRDFSVSTIYTLTITCGLQWCLFRFLGKTLRTKNTFECETLVREFCNVKAVKAISGLNYIPTFVWLQTRKISPSIWQPFQRVYSHSRVLSCRLLAPTSLSFISLRSVFRVALRLNKVPVNAWKRKTGQRSAN